MELTFNKFIKIILDRLWLLVLFVVIFGLAAYSISSFLIKPQYQSSASFMIEKKNEDGDSDITYENTIKQKYITYTLSEDFLEQIKVDLELEDGYIINVEDLKKYIQISDESSQFIVTVTAFSAKNAYLICKKIADKGPNLYKSSDLISGSETKVIDSAKLNTIQISPNVSLNTILGVILGLMFGLFVLISIETIDNSIRSENDLIDNYEIPLLGIVYAHKFADSKTENKK